MACIIAPARGSKFIKVRIHGREVRLRFGRCDIEAALPHVEELADCLETGRPCHAATRRWLEALPPRIIDRLRKHGLTDHRVGVTIDELCDSALDRKQKTCGETSLQVYRQVASNLREYFSGPIGRITPDDASQFIAWLSERYAASTTAKRAKVSREWFDLARKKRWISENPFGEVKIREPQPDAASRVYVERDVIERLIEDATDNEWRLLLALWRFAGLRQLEVYELKWSTVNWDAGRMAVYAPKTKRTRIIPIWPEVRPWLEKQWDDSPAGEHVILKRYRYDTNPAARSTNSNLRSRLERQLLRLGVPSWPDLFKALRSSAETDLARGGQFAQWEIAYWLGHSQRVQERHYLTVTDDAFDRAAGTLSATAKKCVPESVPQNLPRAPKTPPVGGR